MQTICRICYHIDRDLVFDSTKEFLLTIGRLCNQINRDPIFDYTKVFCGQFGGFLPKPLLEAYYFTLQRWFWGQIEGFVTGRPAERPLAPPGPFTGEIVQTWSGFSLSGLELFRIELAERNYLRKLFDYNNLA